MKFSSFVLSSLVRHQCSIRIDAPCSFFVLVVASLSLRNFPCFRLNVSCYNKSNNFAPYGAGRGYRRPVLNRYEHRA